LRIVGLEPGTVLRPAPGRRDVTLRLQAIGAQQGVTWLLDGQLVGSDLGNSQTLTLRTPGSHALTAMDGRGRWARIGFELQAEAPARTGKG
ncbi:hypothetical protein ABTK96_19275, partial [Acinetobacter baumannii]